MDKATFDYVAARADILANAPSAMQETKDAAVAWKAAVSKDNSAAGVQTATEDFLNFLEGRPSTIDNAIAFFSGPAKEAFGEEVAAKKLAEEQARKAAGAKFCGCDACTAASEILAKFGRVEL